MLKNKACCHVGKSVYLLGRNLQVALHLTGSVTATVGSSRSKTPVVWSVCINTLGT